MDKSATKTKLFSRATAPASVPGAVYESNHYAEAPVVIAEAYIVCDDNGGNVDTVEIEEAIKNDGQSITDEESGSESDEDKASLTDGNKKYCGGRLSLTGVILLVVVCLMIIAIPVALVKKNDAFTRKNPNATETGQCRSPRCFTDDDCSFYDYGMSSDNNTSSDVPNHQCYHAVLRCSNDKNLMTDFCPCLRDSDCVSGRCEGFSVGFSKCIPLLEDGLYCNEASDCQSNRCDKPAPGQAPVCIPKITAICGACNEDTDCASGECDYLMGRCRNNNMTALVSTANDGNATTTTLDEGCSCLTTKDCMTGRCDFATNNPLGGRICQLKAPSCGGCNENTDCASNDCMESVFRCRNGDTGLMDDKCNCLSNGDCESDRCEALSLNPLDGFFCFPRNANCKQCNEDSDCLSGKCNLLNMMCGDETGNILNCWS